jgi:hypothetical protein
VLYEIFQVLSLKEEDFAFYDIKTAENIIESAIQDTRESSYEMGYDEGYEDGKGADD